ncbi:helix-turn-helix domain-containing protein [Bradyrhizobium arachidis]|uniref:DNA-binding protein n=1 Tax=Bradyrhizobium arachidis TaxID=858423 RepID=A0AAE7NUS0_9BRAD|nr:helix-turn-helix domain-containing protein [Bradyrhizobium arachidis]QOZ69154.1 DNA-binding protein [Bradyrhizobium arachidis]
MSNYLNTREAARHVRLSTATLERLRVKGGGPTYINPVPDRVVYRVDDLDAWMQSRRRSSTSEAA